MNINFDKYFLFNENFIIYGLLSVKKNNPVSGIV